MRKKFKTGDSKQKILDTAFECFARSGYNGTTVRDICNAAKMNVCAVNYHFGSKEELWLAVCEMASERLREIVMESIDFSTDPVEAVPAFLDKLIDALLERPELIRVVTWINLEADMLEDYEMTQARFQPLIELGSQYLEMQAEKGLIGGELDYNAALTMLNSMLVFSFVFRGGSVRFSGRDMNNPENVAYAKEELIRAAMLLLGLKVSKDKKQPSRGAKKKTARKKKTIKV